VNTIKNPAPRKQKIKGKNSAKSFLSNIDVILFDGFTLRPVTRFIGSLKMARYSRELS
jgi:hypothetical protein